VHDTLMELDTVEPLGRKKDTQVVDGRTWKKPKDLSACESEERAWVWGGRGCV
jgi:hypothetical protein